MDPEIDQDMERKHFIRIVHAFKSYRKFMTSKIQDKQDYIQNMSALHQSLLDPYLKHLNQQKVAVQHNAEIINLIIKDVENMFENMQHEESSGSQDSSNFGVIASDLEKVQSTLKQLVRDWSSEGQAERESSYGPIIQKVESLFPVKDSKPNNIQILVPGAGLGRLPYELAKRGYACQGNEFSLFMLFASNFVLNRLRGLDSLDVYPWIYSGCNVMKNEDQLQCVSFPDTEPSDLPANSHFTMAAGDFLEIYTTGSTWDCIATCFFIDCANNVIAFLETIYNILKPGGYWINLGPLLYHFADQPSENSIEPSYELVKGIITGLGFKIIEEKSHIKTNYTHDKKSMLKYEYSSIFLVAQKPDLK